MHPSQSFSKVLVVGAGPAGLMAAETLAMRGIRVQVLDAMPSVGRKFLMAGKGGMNITHSEAKEAFLGRYGSRREVLTPILATFDPDALRAWVHGLGIDTFVGSSGRVFPTDMKAAPLLRAWKHRLREAGVEFSMRHRWLGWSGAAGSHSQHLRFATPVGETSLEADAVILALGGGSWPQLGSDAGWIPLLQAQGVEVAPLKPANCGFNVSWSEHFRTRFAGEAVKSVVATLVDAVGNTLNRSGEFMVSEHGVEGSLIYAFSAILRDAIEARGSAHLQLDLAPGKNAARVLAEVSHPRGSRSMASHLQSRVGIQGVKAGLLRECLPREAWDDPAQIAAAIKALPLQLMTPRPLAEAISSAGGVRFEALDASLMIRTLPGVFCAGEMLDWEAPTGGYLLTACFATGRTAALGVAEWLSRTKRRV